MHRGQALSRIRGLGCAGPLAAACLAVALAAQSLPQQWRAVPEKSSLRIEVGKAGWLRAFGDEHLIEITEFTLRARFDPAAAAEGTVEFAFPARALKVVDPSFDAGKRAEVQQKMEGPEVLDLARFAGIRFVSRRIVAAGGNRYRVEGELQIREARSSVTVTLELAAETGGYRARGEAPVKLSAFGIQPPAAAGGGVRVRDEMKLRFDILLAKAER